MGIIEIKRDPSRRQLNWFGLVLPLFLTLAGAVVFWRSGALRPAAVIWGAALAVTALYYAVRPVRRPIYLAWVYGAFPVGWLVTHILLAAVFYLVVTPIGLVMRLLGRDPMNRKFDPKADSYWVACKPEDDTAGYFRQF